MQKYRRDEAPPLPPVYQFVDLRAVGQKHLILRAARQPHQKIDEAVGDEEDEGESGRARDDRAKEADGFGVGAGARLYRFGRRAHGRAAHHAAALARADERAAVAAHARSPRACAHVC